LFGSALFLSFSRGAWGQMVFSLVLMLVLLLCASQSGYERGRIVILSSFGGLALAFFIAALLSVDKIADLFHERISMEQNYDMGDTGRFGRHLFGFTLVLDHPLGIGPLQFRHMAPEDPHNTYLNVFLSGGWLAGICNVVVVIATIVWGLRFAFVAAPWRRAYLAIYAAFVGTAGESVLIDSDHWRHYFLLLGVMWGLMVVSRDHLVQQPSSPRLDRRRPQSPVHLAAFRRRQEGQSAFCPHLRD